MEFERFLHAADGGTDADTDGPAIFLFQVDAGVARRHHGGGDGELCRTSHAAGLFPMQKVFGIEIPHLSRKAGLEGRRIERGNRLDRAFSPTQEMPKRSTVLPNGEITPYR